MSVKSRLQKRKPWFTLEQSAQRLSNEFGEEVTIENILELALEGELAISIQVYGAQKALPLQKGKQLGSSELPLLSPISGYRPGAPGLPEEATAHIGAGIYRIGLDSPSAKQQLHRLIAGEAIGTVGTPAWYLIMDDEVHDDPHLYIPLEPVSEIKWLPFPPPQSILVQRDDLESFIDSVGLGDGEPAIACDDNKPLEVLGLLLEALSQRHPGLYAVGERPNRSRIVSDILVTVEGYERPKNPDEDPIKLNGFGKTSIDNVLQDAIGVWEGRKKSNQS